MPATTLPHASSENCLNNMKTDYYIFTTDELGTGRFVDYETIPYRVDTVIEDGDLILVPLNHDWRPEPAHITTIKPIRITAPFLLANGWTQTEQARDLNGDIIGDEPRFILKRDDIWMTLYSRYGQLFVNRHKWITPVLYIHQLQNVMVSAGMSIREMTFLPEYYKANLPG